MAFLPIGITVIIHAEGMNLVGRYQRRIGSRGRPMAVSRRAVHPTVMVGIMLLAHYAEITAWAIFYVVAGMLQGFKTAMNFSINAYTTLGASNIDLPPHWQGLGGVEAMTAMLMFGWSTAVLANAMKTDLG